MTQLKLTRRGEYTVTCAAEADDKTQCGSQGMRTFFYHVEITAPLAALDEHGFLVDQLLIHDRIELMFRHVKWVESCELMAYGIVRRLAHMVPDATRVVAQVGRKPDNPLDPIAAWMEASININPEKPNASPGHHSRDSCRRGRSRRWFVGGR